MTEGIVFRIKKYALHDGPGIRTTVFLKGCPLSCWWCHNPEGIQPGPQAMGDVQAGQRMSVDRVMEEIEKDVVFYDQSGGGVTFSGGEPTLQPQFLGELLAACRALGIHTALDTSGHAAAGVFARLAGLADLVLFDLKIMDPAAHLAFTGMDNELILNNYLNLCRARRPITVRFPLVPEMTDSHANIDALADFVRRGGGPLEIDLLPYHRTAGRKYERLGMTDKMAAAPGVPGVTDRAVQAAKSRLESNGLTVRIGG